MLQIDKIHTVLELKENNPNLTVKQLAKLTGYRIDDIATILEDDYNSDDDLEVFAMYNHPTIEDLNEQY